MYEVNNLSMYLDKVAKLSEGHDKKYFRGQLERYTTISPTLGRDEGYLNNEHAIYQESIKLKPDEFDKLNTPFERLAKMQHYGLPTRLIDITIDPKVALFFAVNDTTDSSDGLVYLYLNDGVPQNDISVQVLSLLPTVSDFSLECLISEYENIYGKSISKSEILKYIDKPVFVQYSEQLNQFNDRLKSQLGTFIICGNLVANQKITHELVTLDSITPSAIFCIPYEYKCKLKEELDLKYQINQGTLFPELPSIAEYIKGKYKFNYFSPEESYSIIQIEDVSHAIAKRISVKVVLKDQSELTPKRPKLTISEIERIALDVVDDYKSRYNVVWVYIAKDGDDYISTNWVIQCQWVDPQLPEKNCPHPFEIYKYGCTWKYSNIYDSSSKYNAKNVFKDDNQLYVEFWNIWMQFKIVAQKIFNVSTNDLTEFSLVAQGNKDTIREFSTELQDIGLSHDKSFNDFLFSIIECINILDNVIISTENEKIKDQNKKHLISKYINDCKLQILKIDKGFENFQSKIL